MLLVYMVGSLYTKTFFEHFKLPRFAATIDGSNAFGKSAALDCGTYVSYELYIEPITKVIEKIIFKSNGCVFMIAVADVLTDGFKGRQLTELHGLANEPQKMILDRFGKIPSERLHCVDAVIASLKSAFADFRRRKVEEFAGEKALICSCFGVTEEALEQVVSQNTVITVSQVGQLCRAGTGCGSCQMMIQEIIDSGNGSP
jgi:NifU-like protein